MKSQGVVSDDLSSVHVGNTAHVDRTVEASGKPVELSLELFEWLMVECLWILRHYRSEPCLGASLLPRQGPVGIREDAVRAPFPRREEEMERD